jgi:hypothetical protein
MNLLLALLCAAASPVQDVEEVRERLKDPAQVFPVFQELLKAGQYAKAREWTLSPKTRAQLPYEAFYTVMTATRCPTTPQEVDVLLRVHKAEPRRDGDPVQRGVRVQRSLRLTFPKLYVPDLNRESWKNSW